MVKIHHESDGNAATVCTAADTPFALQRLQRRYKQRICIRRRALNCIGGVGLTLTRPVQFDNILALLISSTTRGQAPCHVICTQPAVPAMMNSAWQKKETRAFHALLITSSAAASPALPCQPNSTSLAARQQPSSEKHAAHQKPCSTCYSCYHMNTPVSLAERLAAVQQ
jgi:hypothetical protein